MEPPDIPNTSQQNSSEQHAVDADNRKSKKVQPRKNTSEDSFGAQRAKIPVIYGELESLEGDYSVEPNWHQPSSSLTCTNTNNDRDSPLKEHLPASTGQQCSAGLLSAPKRTKPCHQAKTRLAKDEDYQKYNADNRSGSITKIRREQPKSFKKRMITKKANIVSKNVALQHADGCGVLPGAVAVSSNDNTRNVTSAVRRKRSFPNRKTRRKVDGRRPSSRGNEPLVEPAESDQTTVVPVMMPPVFQAIDIFPSMITDRTMSSDVASVQTEATNRTAATVPVRNGTTGSLKMDQATVTTATMIVEGGSSIASAINCERAHIRHSNGAAIPAGEIIHEEDTVISLDTSGKWCESCGIQQTHTKERHGLFHALIWMKPRTVEGRVYEGYCLCSHDVYDLRRLLNDPNIPIGLVRHDPNTSPSLRLLQGVNGQERRDGLISMLPARKRSPIEALCAYFQFQVICGVALVIIAGASIAVGVTLSKDPNPWVSLPPTFAPSPSPTTRYPTPPPTSYGWDQVMTITKNDVESFGYHVELSHDGNTLAVTSPKYMGARGRLDVFNVEALEWRAIGEPIIGSLTDDELGFGMHLSGNGKVVAVGLPGNNAGVVQVYAIDQTSGLMQKGQSIVGPVPLSQFGYSVSLNLDGSRLLIGAPQFGEDLTVIYGLVQAYDFNGTVWIQIGKDIVGGNPSSRFGNSVSTDGTGTRLAVGAPWDTNEGGIDAGRIIVFDFVGLDWVRSDINGQTLYGSKAGSQLGERVSLDCNGNVVASGGHDRTVETHRNSGVVKFWDLATPTFLGGLHTGAAMHISPTPGLYEDANLGHNLQLDCNVHRLPILVASSENRNGQVGPVIIEGVVHTFYSQNRTELGNTTWLGKGPSVTIARQATRFAVGLESVRFNGLSRSEVRIYDLTIT